jgi:putative nucleotidyltransferase with HDIG domain
VRDPLAVLSGLVGDAWLVGGALRDRLLERPTADFDVAIAGQPELEGIARALGRAMGGFAFLLSERFGAWRVVARDRSWQIDLIPLGGDAIRDDLGRRDLTVNAIAESLHDRGRFVDPFGGLEDLRARRLRMVSEGSFAADPLRTLRLARLSGELGFEVEPQTLRCARSSAARLGVVAVERVFGELKRLLSDDRALAGLEVMDAIGATDAVLPELRTLRGVQQSRFHHLDVAEHTRAVLAATIELQRDPEAVFGNDGPALRAVLETPLADELTRGQAMRFGALLHDIAKPQTRGVTGEGRVTFIGHDEAGAHQAIEILGRLRASDRLAEHVAALARHHLRLGFLVHEMPLSRRAVYGYLDACSPVGVDVTVLSVADRLATRGDGAKGAIDRHLELARQLLGEALAWLADPPRPLVRGNDLARALGLRPGPAIGDLLHRLQEASFAGEIETGEQAIEHARRLIDQAG